MKTIVHKLTVTEIEVDLPGMCPKCETLFEAAPDAERAFTLIEDQYIASGQACVIVGDVLDYDDSEDFPEAQYVVGYRCPCGAVLVSNRRSDGYQLRWRWVMRMRDIKADKGWWYKLRHDIIGQVTAVDRDHLRVTVEAVDRGRRWTMHNVDHTDVERIATGEEVTRALRPATHLGGCGSCFLGIIVDAGTNEVQACNDCASGDMGFGSRGISLDDDAAVHLGRILAAMACLRDLCEQEQQYQEEGVDYDTREEFEEAYHTLRVLTRLDSRNMNPDAFADLAAGRSAR